MKWNLLFRILLFTWLIGGCRTLPTSEPFVPATLEVTRPIQPSLTATSRPTTTVAPTEIPQTPTVNPSIAATVIALSPPRILSSSLSPDGKWRAKVLIHDFVLMDPQLNTHSNAVEILNLIRVSDQKEFIIETSLRNWPDYLGGIRGLVWSPNGQYFYYTDTRERVPEGLCAYWARPVKRVLAESQEVELVGGGHLSPDKTKLAFWQNNNIVIWSLDDGEIARIPAVIPDAFKSQIAWSFDSQSLVYLQTQAGCPPFGKSYMTHLDLSEMTQTLLIESEDPSFYWLTWDAPSRISLADEGGNVWKFNLVSKELRLVP